MKYICIPHKSYVADWQIIFCCFLFVLCEADPETLGASPFSSGLFYLHYKGPTVWVRIHSHDTCVSLSKILNHCLVLPMGRKALGPMCYVVHVKVPSALIEKRRALPWCSWSDWQQIAPQHLVKHYMVLSE